VPETSGPNPSRPWPIPSAFFSYYSLGRLELGLEAADLFFQRIVERAELADPGLGGLEIVDTDIATDRGGGLGSQRPALDHVLPAQPVLGDEGAGRQCGGSAFAVMVRAKQTQNALEALDVPLLNRSPPCKALVRCRSGCSLVR
jgi:hypothetical protein